MLRIIAIISVMFLLSLGSFAQDVKLDVDVEEQYQTGFGPNMRHYGHLYVGGGAVPDFDENQGSAIKFWRSSDFVFGYRYKLKICSFYALGADASFKVTKYFFDDEEQNPYDENNPLTYSTDADRHFLTNNSLGLEIYQRINFGKRGNTLGNYLDVGVAGNWNHTVKEVIVFKSLENMYAEKRKIINRKLNFYENFGYGLSARVGIKKYLLYGYYRLSDYFNDKYDIPEMPRLTVGIQFVLN